MALNVPAYLSDYATNKLRQDGVEVHTGVVIKNFEVNETKALNSNSETASQESQSLWPGNFTLTLSNDQKVQTDHVGK